MLLRIPNRKGDAMKKTLLTLGSATMLATPIVAVVSCGEVEESVSLKTGAIMLEDGYKKGFTIDEINVYDFKAVVTSTERSDSTLVQTNTLLTHRLTLPKKFGMSGHNEQVINYIYDLGAAILLKNEAKHG